MVNAISDISASSSTSSSPASTQTASIGGDYLTFLRMLTTQLQNQDPLNPMEGSEFAVQLATFSGVEQQVRTNELLAQLVEGTGGTLSQLADWIGREIRTTSEVWFDQDPLTLVIEPEDEAESVTLVTLDSQGREVRREEIGTGSGEVDWLGRDANGEPLPSGSYRFRLECLRDGELIGIKDVGVYARVTGAEIGSAGPRLILEGNLAVGVDEVTALRE
ncbi:flagellar hook capping FlgD N-terminal domain-containing protein [Paracoccus sp. MBLB3053]|uniref:Basal-body rod modification protein FlgD n=1 Tax=Paracoccus aurantius TaxID=3073814 RepID=A0ABU2HM13_9RHOB|nr:flagellar hook capping FlgD N-terminal domain-containing protein [Paracoccus sp. MBLB3053]MDS9466063.1 flagellar hook capping FlgD N-terminal domain-containing protein [Paracoccus sp. MBLB3053]